MITFALRNMELFFRDRFTVLMSLLAEVIIMVLYIMFMRDNLITQFTTIENADKILDVWMISGILGITPVTAATGAYGVMIEDKAVQIDRDFITSPLGQIRITCGYLTGASLSGILISFLVLLISQGYMICRYGSTAGAGNIMEIYGMMIIGSICCAAMMILPVSFLKTSNSLAGCCTIFGALIGFMTGIYLPVGSLGESAAGLVKGFPVSHGVTVLRQLMTGPVMAETIDMDSAAALEFKEYMGIVLVKEGEVLTRHNSITVMILWGAACLLFTVLKNLASERCR